MLADEIGSWHLDVSIDGVVSSLLSLFQTLTGKRPRYKVEDKHFTSPLSHLSVDGIITSSKVSMWFFFQVDGGSNIENLGLQNIQARIRMVLAFMLASLLPWVHSKPGFYLVLGSSNVDEALRGYLTKVVFWFYSS